MPAIPPPVASGLLFRLPTAADADALQPILDDPVVRTAMYWPGQHTAAGQWIEDQLRLHEHRGPSQVTSEFYPFLIEHPAPSAVVGVAQVIIAFDNRTVLTGELRSLFFAAGHRDQGHGSEALSALTRWAFDDVVVEAYDQRGTLKQVLAVCNPDNTAANSLLGKHLKDEGIVDSNPDQHGEVRPVRRFRLTRDQYNSRVL